MTAQTATKWNKFDKHKNTIIIGSVVSLIAIIMIVIICVSVKKSKKTEDRSSTQSSSFSSTSTETTEDSSIDDKEVYDPFPTGKMNLPDYEVNVSTDDQLSNQQFLYVNNVLSEIEIAAFCTSIPTICHNLLKQRDNIIEMEANAHNKVTDYQLLPTIIDGTLYAYTRIQQLLLIGTSAQYHTEIFGNPEIYLDKKPMLRKQLIAATSLLLYITLERGQTLNTYLKKTNQIRHKLVYKKDYGSDKMKVLIRLIDFVSFKSFYITKDTYINSIERLKSKFYTIRSPEAGWYAFLVSSIPALLNLLGTDTTKHDMSPVFSYDILVPLCKSDKLGEFKEAIGKVKEQYELLMEVLLRDQMKFNLFEANETLIRLTTQVGIMNEMFQ